MVVEFKALTPIDRTYGLPPRGTKLPWSSHSSLNSDNTDIGGFASKLVDLVMIDGRQMIIYTPTPDGKRYPAFKLPAASYEMEIQVGSERDIFEPVKVKLRIVYSGGMKIDINKIDD